MLESFLRGRIRKYVSGAAHISMFALAISSWTDLINLPNYILGTWFWGYGGFRLTLHILSRMRWKFQKEEDYYLSITWPVTIWFWPWAIAKFETEWKLRQVSEVMGS